MEKRKAIILVCIIGIIFLIIILSILGSNKTFFKTSYETKTHEKIYIPRFSYYDKKSTDNEIILFSLEKKESLEKKRNKYLKSFEYISNMDKSGYKKDNLFITSYEVEEVILYRKITIKY